MSDFQVGQILEHTELPEMGRVKVEQVSVELIRVQSERKNGGENRTFRLPNPHFQLSNDQSAYGFDAPKAVKRAAKGAPKAEARPVLPFEEALAAFQAKYPAAFSDPKYLKAERAPKAAALAAWQTHFSAEALAKAKASQDPGAIARAFKAVYEAIPLLHPAGEWLPFFKALSASPEAFTLAQRYADAVAAGSFTEESFSALAQSFEAVGLGRPKWTVFTCWPCLATASGFAFVKPTLIQGAAPGLGIALNYEPFANWLTYTQALSVYEELLKRLQPLGAQDWIDVQSFLWIGWKK